MSEIVILCNEEQILCDSVAYYVDGAGIKSNVEYGTTAYDNIGYDTTAFLNVDHESHTFFLTFAAKFFLVSSGDNFKVRAAPQHYNIRY